MAIYRLLLAPLIFFYPCWLELKSRGEDQMVPWKRKEEDHCGSEQSNEYFRQYLYTYPIPPSSLTLFPTGRNSTAFEQHRTSTIFTITFQNWRGFDAAFAGFACCKVTFTQLFPFFPGVLCCLMSIHSKADLLAWLWLLKFQAILPLPVITYWLHKEPSSSLYDTVNWN